MLRLTSNVISWVVESDTVMGRTFHHPRSTSSHLGGTSAPRVSASGKTTSPTGACMCRKRHPVKSYRAQKRTPHSVGEPEWTSRDFPGQK